MKYRAMKERVSEIETIQRDREKLKDAWTMFSEHADDGKIQTALGAILVVYQATKGYMEEGVSETLREYDRQIEKIESESDEQEGGE